MGKHHLLFTPLTIRKLPTFTLSFTPACPIRELAADRQSDSARPSCPWPSVFEFSVSGPLPGRSEHAGPAPHKFKYQDPITSLHVQRATHARSHTRKGCACRCCFCSSTCLLMRVYCSVARRFNRRDGSDGHRAKRHAKQRRSSLQQEGWQRWSPSKAACLADRDEMKSILKELQNEGILLRE